MGYGDELMAAGHAAALSRRTGRAVRILDRRGRRRWNPLWEENPHVARPASDGDLPAIVNGVGARPYIDHERSTRERWIFREHRCTPATLFGLAGDRRANDCVVLEPEIKAEASPNKQWGRWRELVALRPELPWAQLGGPGTAWLPGVRRIETASFREACAVLAGCTAAVLPEGGLHHAAAALGVPAVVLFGSYSDPRITGYEQQDNLAVDDPEGVGWRIPHEACARAWQRIPPELVLERVEALLAARAARHGVSEGNRTPDPQNHNLVL